MPEWDHQIMNDLLSSTGAADGVSAAIWADIRKQLPGVLRDQWLDAFRDLGELTADRPRTSLDLARVTPWMARTLGSDAALELAKTTVKVARHAGNAAAGVLTHSRRAAVVADGPEGFHIWLASLAELAAAVPEVVGPVAGRTDTLLARLGPRGFRAWLVSGLAISNHDARLVHFARTDAAALEAFGSDVGQVRLAMMEKRLKAMVVGLWGAHVILRPASAGKALPVARRASFDGPLIRLPDSFAGFSAANAEALFKAAVAHLGAHRAFSLGKFEVRELRPLQVVLVSLIEDARVELLAAREFPGLLRLWKRFHIVGEADVPADLNPAEPLLARLARALIDPDFPDASPWIAKARGMFREAGPDYDDPAEIRRIGMLLGNDLGQMRVQFNAKTYVVQPAYRDDNMGIWDFGPPPDTADETDSVVESIRIERTEDPHNNPDREQKEHDPGSGEPTGRVRHTDATQGVAVAQYPEWDYLAARQIHDWTTLVEYDLTQMVPGVIDRILDDYADTKRRIEVLVRLARVSRPVRLRCQVEGDRLDLDAAIRVASDLRAGLSPEARVYESSALLQRDLSVLVLLDVSESTKDTIRGGIQSAFSVERAATALLAEAMDGMGDPFALHAFCSDGRSDVRYHRIKDFGQPYNAAAKARFGGLRPGFSTRLGAALRHAGEQISGQLTHRRLILVITDGEPSDVDVDDCRYLAEDARKAVHDLGKKGTDVFCVALTRSRNEFPDRIFGRRNYIQIFNVDRLPEMLPMLFLKLTT